MVYYNGNTTNVLILDPTLEFRSILLFKHPYFVSTLILSIVLIFLPTLFLVFYPTRLARMLIRCIFPGRLRGLLLIFMESFQGYYKNGTTGTYDYRAASCISFLIRILMAIQFQAHWDHINPLRGNIGPLSAVVFVMILTSLFYALVRPCKKQYMNVIESLLYCTAGMLLIILITHNSYDYGSGNIVLLIILLPSVVFVAVIISKVLKVIGIVKKTEKLFVKLIKLLVFKKQEKEDVNEPHRLTNPTEYSPLP